MREHWAVCKTTLSETLKVLTAMLHGEIKATRGAAQQARSAQSIVQVFQLEVLTTWAQS